MVQKCSAVNNCPSVYQPTLSRSREYKQHVAMRNRSDYRKYEHYLEIVSPAHTFQIYYLLMESYNNLMNKMYMLLLDFYRIVSTIGISSIIFDEN